MEFIMGGIIMFGGNFYPRNWAFCNGQLVAINQNQALFAILGTNYGGDGRTTFALPDLQGRVPIGVGRGPGLTAVFQGQKRGRETHTLNIDELATHSHTSTFTPTTGTGGAVTATATMVVGSGTGDESSPVDNYLAGANKIGVKQVKTYTSTKELTTLAADAITVNIQGGGGGGITGGTVQVDQAGAGQEFFLMNPNLGMQYIMAVQGEFPSRN